MKMKKLLYILFFVPLVALGAVNIRVKKDVETPVSTTAPFSQQEVVDVKDALSDIDVADTKAKYALSEKEQDVLGKMLKKEQITFQEIPDAISVFRIQLTDLLADSLQPNGKYYIRSGTDASLILGFHGEKLTLDEKVRFMSKRKLKI